MKLSEIGAEGQHEGGPDEPQGHYRFRAEDLQAEVAGHDVRIMGGHSHEKDRIGTMALVIDCGTDLHRTIKNGRNAGGNSTRALGDRGGEQAEVIGDEAYPGGYAGLDKLAAHSEREHPRTRVNAD
jgi:hypothetical protein